MTLNTAPLPMGVVWFWGWVATVGGEAVTVTVKLQGALVFPLESVPVQLPGVVPNARVEPEAGVHVKLPGPAQLSLARGGKFTGMLQAGAGVAGALGPGDVRHRGVLE